MMPAQMAMVDELLRSTRLFFGPNEKSAVFAMQSTLAERDAEVARLTAVLAAVKAAALERPLMTSEAKALRARVGEASSGVWKAVPVATCVWTYDSDDTEGDSWFTACHQRFVFTCDGPREHGMAFCCYCGKRLTPITPPPAQEATP